MTPVILNSIFSKTSADTVPDIWFGSGEDRRKLKVVRHVQARRMKLQMDPRDGSVRLTIPKRAPLSPALKWVETKRGWIEAQLARRPAGQGIAPGMDVPLRGEPHRLDWSPDWSRTPRVAEDCIRIGGPAEGLEGRLSRWLKREAQALLETETRALAARTGRTVTKVGVGDTVSRWGSCSSQGAIRYSWRLILVPDSVRRMIVAHEVAHLVHMNHGPAFHALARDLAGESAAPANRWLKANAARVHGFGAGS